MSNKPLTADQIKKISKRLSLHLRHKPHELGLELDEGGWIEVAILLAAYGEKYGELTRETLELVVAGNDKQRFAFDDSNHLIRASQGHSLDVDLGLVSVTPPPELFHGTQSRIVPIILVEGLKKMARQHVHLSVDAATAVKVGSRHGRPVVLLVNASDMHREGFTFYCSANGVWLTDHVPPKYLMPAG